MVPTISVVIPCYNSASWLREAVESVWAQTRRDLELILVDDGSSDATPAVIKAVLADAAADGFHARGFTQDNEGVAAARNFGIANARGHYILPLDADDILHPSMIGDCAALLDGDPSIEITYTDRQDFGDSTQRWSAGCFDLDRLKYFNQLSYCALYRRSLWHRVGGYRTNVTGFDDWDFWLAAALLGAKAYYLPQPYLLHRRRASSQLWDLLPSYETLYARIILNNADAFSDREQGVARAFLNGGKPAGLLCSSRFIFLHHYYPEHLQPCES